MLLNLLQFIFSSRKAWGSGSKAKTLAPEQAKRVENSPMLAPQSMTVELELSAVRAEYWGGVSVFSSLQSRIMPKTFFGRYFMARILDLCLKFI